MLVLCGPDSATYRAIRFCSSCQQRRRFVIQVFEWYDSIGTCCACGDAWSGGERQQRPFARGWRSRAIQRARQSWDTAGTRAEAMAWMRARLET